MSARFKAGLENPLADIHVNIISNHAIRVQKNAFKKSKNPSPFPPKTMVSYYEAFTLKSYSCLQYTMDCGNKPYDP